MESDNADKEEERAKEAEKRSPKGDPPRGPSHAYKATSSMPIKKTRRVEELGAQLKEQSAREKKEKKNEEKEATKETNEKFTMPIRKLTPEIITEQKKEAQDLIKRSTTTKATKLSQ